ncbi:hypothetical protein [Photobacterium leiognathi]|uniref:hypothetical protein n=1 Tax=Photobacterium leiognathi TaxID=553611 RepID=UPI002982A3AB|nr:hypothetical protein [Photobacterium leiognathi]
MSKIHISHVEVSCERFIKTMTIGDAFEVLTFKKDRGFCVLKQSEAEYSFKQFGYIDQMITVDANALKKKIKKAVKVEFPRSNIAWVEHFQQVDSIDDLKRHGQAQYHLF